MLTFCWFSTDLWIKANDEIIDFNVELYLINIQIQVAQHVREFLVFTAAPLSWLTHWTEVNAGTLC